MTPRSVTGEMWVDGQFECYTLEPAYLEPVHPGHPAIPVGRYQVILTPSPHLGYLCPEVLKVPGRLAIRWHVGNRPEDVLGCVAVGLGHVVDWVSESRKAFEKLMTLLQFNPLEPIWVTYSDPEDKDGKP